MTLSPGTRVGVYEIVSPLGSGGMGEVYRARDDRLHRDVALKVLPETFTLDADRLARFRREAQVLASLNHPNIGAIYGLEEWNGGQALVLELVEGPTLAEALTGRSYDVDQALPIAKQIAEAVEAAHEQGIVHRDLKPANIKLRPDGTVKVLDFGLAKALEPVSGVTSELTASPTITSPAMTRLGIIVGTAAYMSPEQARGKQVDKRADIWAFGVVLYELVTGRRPFNGEDVSEVLAAVIKEQPGWDGVPPKLRGLLESCLEKDPKKRLRDIGDAWRLLETTPGAPASVASPSRIGWIAAGVLAVGLAALVPAAIRHFREPPPRAAEPIRFQIAPPDLTLAGTGAFAVSPDGRTLAFTAAGSDNVMRVWLRSLDSIDARPLAGSDNPTGQNVAWSPDSRFVAFGAPGKLKKVEISGGPAQDVCDVKGTVAGITWNRDGVILFGQNPGSIMRVSASGGTAVPLTAFDQSREEFLHLLPSFLPDGHHFVYLRVSTAREKSGAFVGSIDAKPGDQSLKAVLTTNFEAVFTPVQGDIGRLLYWRDRTLLAQPFDDRTLELSGEAVPIAEQLGSFLSNGFFSVSPAGVLVYKTGSPGQDSQLTWFDRRGKVLGSLGDPHAYTEVALSGDGARAAASWYDIQRGYADLWLLDVATGVTSRFTFGPNNSFRPIWSPDGNTIIFSAARDTRSRFDLYLKPANGATDERLLLKTDNDKAPTSWSPDGRYLLFGSVDAKLQGDLWMLPLEDKERKPVPLLATPFNERDARFSPDGRLVAYTSDETGRTEVYVREFTPASLGGKRQVSRNGGTSPRWRRDGKSLFFWAPDNTLMTVDVTGGAGLQPAAPTPVYNLRPSRGVFGPSLVWDVAADGQRFLAAVPVQQNFQTPFTVVLNWQAALKK